MTEQEKVVPKGGCEILLKNLYKYVDVPSYNTKIIMSACSSFILDSSQKNVVWQHLNTDESSVVGMGDNQFKENVDAFVYVSYWQYQKYCEHYGSPFNKSFVIKNAIEPIEYIGKPKGEKVKLIYTSTPWRGLDILLGAVDLLNETRDDFELDVYSSTIIYGSGFDEKNKETFQKLFDKAEEMKNVNYIGYASNDDVKTAVQGAHIFAYPSIFEETFCMSMVEAGAAGCQIITTALGALPEIGSTYARYMPLKETREDLIIAYAKELEQAIDDAKTSFLERYREEQSEFFNKYYSWETRKHEWVKFFESLG